MSNSIKLRLLLALIAVVLSAVFFIEPIPQDLNYHQFADTNALAGIPNMWNVLSNVPFVLIGIYGFFIINKINSVSSLGEYRIVCQVFFIGMILTGFGSGYYHIAPANETLMWDRLPMTISFMAFFSFILSQHIHKRYGALALWPLLGLGVLSVLYWTYTESLGLGDLRFYAVVQFLPMLMIPIILFMFPVSNYKQKYIWLVILFYFVAKLLEGFDGEVYELLYISGHSLKHVAAAVTGIVFLYAVKTMQSSVILND